MKTVINVTVSVVDLLEVLILSELTNRLSMRLRCHAQTKGCRCRGVSSRSGIDAAAGRPIEAPLTRSKPCSLGAAGAHTQQLAQGTQASPSLDISAQVRCVLGSWNLAFGPPDYRVIVSTLRQGPLPHHSRHGMRITPQQQSMPKRSQNLRNEPRTSP